jgi:DNA invertase Pin-like site-specific DNA recombinase
MNIGYARTSALEQVARFEAQTKALKKAGCDRIFKEQVSIVGLREQLELALYTAREGDTLTVTKLDRLARSTSHLVKLTDKLQEKGVRFVVMDLGLDTGTQNGRLMVTMLGAVSQFERELMLERHREGIAKAKAEGKYVGRQPTARAKTTQLLELKAQGLGVTEIINKLEISRASYYRILKEQTDTYDQKG